MRDMVRKILDLLTPAERRSGALLLVMVIVMAVLETAGIASVLPFLAVLGNPEIVEANLVLRSVYDRLGFEEIDDFLMALGVASFAMVIFAAGFRIITQYAMYRFTQMRRHSIGERLLETYLRQPYEFFLNRHSADMATSILSEVDVMVQYVFTPGFTLIAYSFVTVCVITLLLFIDPWLALGMGVLIGGLYALIFMAIKGLIGRMGRDLAKANRERFTAAGEALGGIKAIKLLGRELAYLSRFHVSSIRFARHQANNATLAQVPKYFIEAIGVGGVLALSLFLMVTGDGAGGILPVLGLYAFAGYRLLPAAQHIYAGIANIRFGAASVDRVHQDLFERASLAEIRQDVPLALKPANGVELRNVSYTYPGAPVPALRDVCLTIPVGKSVGIVGGTGAGKTTLIDIFLGLLGPTTGTMLVDDVPVTAANVRAWQKALGYVPQDIFLTDSSIAENIALGVPRAEIDRESLESCSKLAQIHEFVMGQLPNGYDTEVGERGVRLSGGQKQRIGIARALYHDPPVLVFDEATSALDNLTESAVMDAVKALSRQKTVILIAHRLTTVRDCDKIVLLAEGKVVAEGKFDDLARTSESFRSMARAVPGSAEG